MNKIFLANFSNAQLRPSADPKLMRIKTNFDYPPVPDRRFDWSAIDPNRYEPGEPIGYGETEQEAIDDLLAQLQEQ